MKNAEFTMRDELTQRLRSFKHAASGIRCALAGERNFRFPDPALKPTGTFSVSYTRV